MKILLHLLLCPASAAGFMYHLIAAAFLYGQHWGQRFLLAAYDDPAAKDRRAKAALAKAQAMFPGMNCRVVGDAVICENPERAPTGAKH